MPESFTMDHLATIQLMKAMGAQLVPARQTNASFRSYQNRPLTRNATIQHTCRRRAICWGWPQQEREETQAAACNRKARQAANYTQGGGPRGAALAVKAGPRTRGARHAPETTATQPSEHRTLFPKHSPPARVVRRSKGAGKCARRTCSTKVRNTRATTLAKDSRSSCLLPLQPPRCTSTRMRKGVVRLAGPSS